MSEQDLLEKAIEDITFSIDYLPKTDSVSLILFVKTPRILVDHTKNKRSCKNAVDEALPGASTRLTNALNLASDQLKTSPYTQKEIIIFQMEILLMKILKKLKKIINKIPGCISTVNYGTSLLQKQVALFDTITEQRNCGIDIIPDLC